VRMILTPSTCCRRCRIVAAAAVINFTRAVTMLVGFNNFAWRRPTAGLTGE
jgi:hypothetical protein